MLEVLAGMRGMGIGIGTRKTKKRLYLVIIQDGGSGQIEKNIPDLFRVMTEIRARRVDLLRL